MSRTDAPDLPFDAFRELRVRAFREAIRALAERLRREKLAADRKEC